MAENCAPSGISNRYQMLGQILLCFNRLHSLNLNVADFIPEGSSFTYLPFKLFYWSPGKNVPQSQCGCHSKALGLLGVPLAWREHRKTEPPTPAICEQPTVLMDNTDNWCYQFQNTCFSKSGPPAVTGFWALSYAFILSIWHNIPDLKKGS